MALVVAARAHILAPAAEVGRTRRGQSALRGVAAASVIAYAAALAVDTAVRAFPSSAWLATADVGLAGVAAVLVLAACVGAWLRQRADSSLLLAATIAPVLLALRAVLMGLLETLERSTLAGVLGLALGLLTLGSLVWAAAGWACGSNARHASSPELELFRRVAEVSALLVFSVAVSGGIVAAVGASWACGGAFPDCNGLGVLPFGRDPLADLQLYHRLLVYVSLGIVVWLTIEAFRTQRAIVGLTRLSLVLLGAVLLDGVIGAVSVSIEVPPLAQVAHSAAAALTWSAAVAVVVVARRGMVAETPVGALPVARPTGALRRKALAYLQLTKPRVMSLLLATTAAAMIVAARGLPPLGIFLATLLGGALMSGGAGAINHYVDRDIDPLMGRTAWRPIPSGVIAPRHALVFGIGLAALASAVFVVFVNPLALVLALMGLLGYVFIYTLWLKRSTPSNIVIGGAAGAIPPLVGWAAATNEVSSLTAWYLFAIIFFWTPPHFWALSLLIRQHYERAGVPMLPVVRGEGETRFQIILYSILLVVLTLVLSPFGMMGPIYFVVAVLLGGLFIVDALRLWREATRAAARQLYLYSILYLFALFTAMAVDRVLLR